MPSHAIELKVAPKAAATKAVKTSVVVFFEVSSEKDPDMTFH